MQYNKLEAFYYDNGCMTMKKNLFITDMDGTLLPKSKVLNPVDLEAIYKLQSLGGKFSVATGRSFPSAVQYFGELKINAPAILLNGSVVYDCEKFEYIFSDYLHLCAFEIIDDVLRNFPEMGAEIDTENMIYVPQTNEAEDYHIELSYTENDYAFMQLYEIPKEKWYKILFADNPANISLLREYLYDKNYDKVDIIPSSISYVEILPKGSSKGSALRKIIEAYKYFDYTVAAAGDFNNDLTMLEAADIAIAPSNALDIVKNAADYVTKASCDDGCIAEAINYLLDKCKD